MSVKPRIVVMFACIVVLATATIAAAQTTAKIPVYRLEPRVVPDIPGGKAVLVSGKAGVTPHRFFLENLHMLVPVLVTVRSVNPQDVINVKITKLKWDDPLREGNTAGGNQVSFRFRTQGEFQVSLDSAKPAAPYKMMVWVGKDIRPGVRPVFVPKSQYDDGKSRWWLWIGLAAVAGIIAVLGFVRFKRKQVP